MQQPVPLVFFLFFVYSCFLESLEPPALKTCEHFCQKTEETVVNTFVKRRIASPKTCLPDQSAYPLAQKTMISSSRSTCASSPLCEASEEAVRWNKRGRSDLRQAWLDGWFGRGCLSPFFLREGTWNRRRVFRRGMR